MRVVRFRAYLLHLPLRKEIKHASTSRHESTNVLIGCELEDGTVGWGEGVPRSYVTGETPEGAIAQWQASNLAQFGRDCQNWSDVIKLCREFSLAQMQDDPRECYGNALRCAVELSLLDAFGIRFGEPVNRIVPLIAEAEPVRTHLEEVRYSGAVTAEKPFKEVISALKMRIYGFQHCKVKVGISANEGDRLKRIRQVLGKRIVIRVDANEAWPIDQVVSRIEPLLPADIACVEQPSLHEEVEGLAEVRRQIDVPIMLDESLTSMVDANAAIQAQTCDLFNIRLSKCGGFLRSLDLAACAQRHGLGYQLGCHPGESGILSAAGRHWATSVADIRFLEGSYDRHLLKDQLTRPDITFQYGGRARRIDRPGLGVSIDPQAIDRLAESQGTYEVS
ncbi:dipeptide epimerase [Bremerella sp. JC817]|uniref:dipeptide epimerase n=1 Tax=Bremerella sp. JC817 TaxID=3231756 RepID=UPI00345A284C